jgi:hypothetical protein
MVSYNNKLHDFNKLSCHIYTLGQSYKTINGAQYNKMTLQESSSYKSLSEVSVGPKHWLA